MEKDEEGKWKVKDMNAFVNDLFPGFKEAINAYSLQNK